MKVKEDQFVEALVFWDPGATLSLVTHAWARNCQLESRPCTVYLKVVNKACEKIRTKEYQFWLMDRDKREYEVWAVGLESITDEIVHCSLDAVYDKFPEIDRESLQRPSGSVNVLLGMDHRGLHPVEYLTKDNLRVTRSKFGTGFILTGATSCNFSGKNTNTEAGNLCQASRLPILEAQVHHMAQKIEPFWEAEDLGCSPIRSCKSCRSCPNCRYRAENLTTAERRSVEDMEASLTLTNGKPPIQISYPLYSHAHDQISNHRQAMAVQKAHEKRVVKDGLLEEYNQEMQKALDSGNVVRLSEEEISNWKGGIHYIVHFPIQKQTRVH